MEIKAENYSITYEPTVAVIHCRGELRLPDMEEYDPIVQLLHHAVEQGISPIILNLSELESLNSTGITVFATFVMDVSEKENLELVVRGNKQITWQTKALKNFQRLMPALQLEWV